MSISANLVKELRERTGAGMMECKKALLETNGDIETAIELMRKSGQAKAAKKAGRIAAEGVIIIKSAADQRVAAIVEINCETDFVARDESFLHFANQVAEAALQHRCHDLAQLMQLSLDNATVETARQELIVKIGENISVRRVAIIEGALVASYLHGTRIGVLALLEAGNTELGRDVAMHIAATNPTAIAPAEVPADVVAKEREIALAQSQSSGKPADIIEKMVQGRVKKFLDEVTLLGQPFVKDPAITVEQLLGRHKAKVVKFIRFEVGEGIEKQTGDFVAEVMAQVHGGA